MKETLNVGVARRCITPPLGTILYGYPLARAAQAVGDDLHVVAAAFAWGDVRALLISADICSCSSDFVAVIRNAITEKTGIPGKQIIFCATHTHSGPNTSLRATGWGKPNLEFMENTLLPQTVEAAAEAVGALQPALFGVGVTQSDVGCNRRVISPEGEVGLGQNPWGVFDRDMTVMSFKNAQTGECMLNIIHYSAHATASAENYEITRDWPGVMKDVLEAESGGVCMFLAGAIGECGPRCPNGRTTQSFAAAKALGYRAGLDAVVAWRSVKEWKNAPVCLAHGDVTIPFDPLPAQEDAVAAITWLESEENLRDQEKSDDIPRRKASDKSELLRWKNILKEYERPALETAFVYPQSILAIGDVAIVPMPFELFLYPTLQLRLYSTFRHTLSVSNANGARAYLPSKDQLCMGGYEVWQFRYANTYKMVDNAADYVVTENLPLLKQAYETLASQA